MNENAGGRERVEIALIGWQRPELVAQLQREFTLHPVHSDPDPLASLRALGPRIRGAVGNGMQGLSRPHMDAMPKLEICAIHGVGLETSDVAEARARGITLTITPVLYDDVADLAIALALAASRLIVEGDRYVRAGDWRTKGRMRIGRKFTGMRTGIIGLGRIGIEVARRLEGFRALINYADPVAHDVPYRRYPDAVALARESDVLFLCAAGAPKGKAPPIIGRDVIDALGPRGIFVNVARGWLVDEQVLTEALVSGRLGAAGLDVFDDEPNVPEALVGLDNVVLTPHVASATEETGKAMADCVVDNLVSWFAGRGAITPVS